MSKTRIKKKKKNITEGNRKRFDPPLLVPPLPPRETTSTTAERWAFGWVTGGVGGRDHGPQLLQGTGPERTRPNGVRPGGGGGSPSRGGSHEHGAAGHIGEEAHSGVSSMSKVSDSGGSKGKGGRLWGAHPDPSRLQLLPGCPPSAGSPPRLTELAARVGLGSLAAVTELHERVQGARGHGQVDGVAEGGAGRRRGKQRNHPSQGMAGALRHPPALPRRAPGRRAVLGELSGRKGAPGGGERAPGAWLSTAASPPSQAGSPKAPGESSCENEPPPAQHTNAFRDTPGNTYGVTQMNLVFR